MKLGRTDGCESVNEKPINSALLAVAKGFTFWTFNSDSIQG
jgi:hypothetical protein